MEGEMNDPGDGSTHSSTVAAPLGEGGFVVVESQEIAGDDDYDVVPGADLNDADSVNAQGETGGASSRTPSAPFVPEAFQAIGSSLSAGARSSRRSSSSSTSVAAAAAQGSSSLSSASIVQPDNNDDHDDRDGPAGGDGDPASSGDHNPSAPFDLAAAFLAVTEALYEFFYAYAIVVYHEAMALVEKAYALAGSARAAWNARGPLPRGGGLPPSLKRAVKHKLFPLVLALVLSLLVILPAWYLVPRGGPPRLSARQWQARYEELSSKHSAAVVRSRLKYDNLAGRHVELQAEYEAVLDDLKKQAPPDVDGACQQGSETNPDSCNQDAANGPLAMAKDALLLAEQAAYDMFRHFSEGLREDAHEVKGLFQRKTRSWFDALR